MGVGGNMVPLIIPDREQEEDFIKNYARDKTL